MIYFVLFTVLLLILLICIFSFKFFRYYFNTINNSYHTRGGLSYKNKQCRFGKKGNVIKEDDINYYRELPCGKDILLAYWIIFNYDLGRKDEDFIGAILLKWIKDGNIELNVNNNDIYLHFLSKPNNCNEIEEKFYYYIIQASFGNNKIGFGVDKVLDSREFKIWCQNNHSKLSSWFSQILDYEVDNLIEKGKITVEKIYNGNKYEVYYIVNEEMYSEAVKMAGLKKFLNDFTITDDRKYIEVEMFDYYLIYAILLGEADKVFSEFKELYPKALDFTLFDVINMEDIRLIDFIIN